MIKQVSAIFFFAFLCSTGIAQQLTKEQLQKQFLERAENFQIVDPQMSPYPDPGVYSEIKFKWDMPGNVQAPLNAGILSLQESQPDMAVFHLNQALALDNAQWVALYYRGVAFIKLHKYEQAAADLAKCIQLKPWLAEAYEELGMCYFYTKNLSMAASGFNKAISIERRLGRSYYYLGLMALLYHQPGDPLDYFRRSVEMNNKYAPAYLMLAIDKKKRKFEPDLNENDITLYDRAVDADPTFIPALYYRALFYLRLQKPDKSLEDFSRLLALRPDRPAFLVLRGLNYLKLSDYPKAFTDLRKAFLSEEPGDLEHSLAMMQSRKEKDLLNTATEYLIANGYSINSTAFEELKKAFCFLYIGKLKLAIKSMSVSDSLDKNAPARLMKAVTFEGTNFSDSAIAYYRKALELDSNIFIAHRQLGFYKMKAGDYKGAKLEVQQMQRLNPEAIAVSRLTGEISFNTNDFVQAVNSLTTYVKSDTTSAEIYRMLAESNARNGDGKMAAKYWIISEKIKPHEKFYNTLATYYLLAKDTPNAVIAYKNCLKKGISPEWQKLQQIKLHADDVNLAITLVLVNLKDWHDATLKFNELKNVFSDDLSLHMFNDAQSVYHYLEARILDNEGFPKQAIESYSFCLALNPDFNDAKYYRAVAYLKSDQKSKALADLTDLKKSNYESAQKLYSRINQ